jgi:hypothetical protein
MVWTQGGLSVVRGLVAVLVAVTLGAGARGQSTPCYLNPQTIPGSSGPIWVQTGEAVYWVPTGLGGLGTVVTPFAANQDIRVRLSAIEPVGADGGRGITIDGLGAVASQSMARQRL